MGRLHFVLALLLLGCAGALEVSGLSPSVPTPTSQNASIRENPASYRPVYIPVPVGSSSGGSGGYGSGK